MVWNKRIIARLGAVLLGIAAGGVGASDPAPLATIQQAYQEIAPALCLVSFSSEITNPASGQTSRRETQALGVMVSPDGLVLTHGHMKIANVTPFNIRVKAGQGSEMKEYPAVLLQKPHDINVCLLRLQDVGGARFPYVRFTRNIRLELGEPVLVFGLLGETLGYTASFCSRQVGAVLSKPRTTYCLDERLLPVGFVGGPVVNRAGAVVGVTGYDLSADEGGEVYLRSGYPLVFQADLFAKYVDSPPVEAKAGRGGAEPWLGVFTQPLTDDLAEYWGLEPTGGVVVSTIVPGSPGASAGLQRGDVVVEFNGAPVRIKEDREVLGFTKMVLDSPLGAPVPMKVLRRGQPLELSVVMTERPRTAREADEFEDAVFGLTVREITTDVRLLENLSDQVQGVIVRRVKSGGRAHLAGIPGGAIIMNFGGRPIASLDEYKAASAAVAAEKPKEVAVFCRVGPQTGFFRMEPVWDSGAGQ